MLLFDLCALFVGYALIRWADDCTEKNSVNHKAQNLHLSTHPQLAPEMPQFKGLQDEPRSR